MTFRAAAATAPSARSDQRVRLGNASRARRSVWTVGHVQPARARCTARYDASEPEDDSSVRSTGCEQSDGVALLRRGRCSPSSRTSERRWRQGRCAARNYRPIGVAHTSRADRTPTRSYERRLLANSANERHSSGRRSESGSLAHVVAHAFEAFRSIFSRIPDDFMTGSVGHSLSECSSLSVVASRE